MIESGRLKEAPDISKYEKPVYEMLENEYYRLQVHQKDVDFTIDTLAREIESAANRGDCDMIVLDHLDYFDFFSGIDQNENMRIIMKTLREINKLGIAIIAVSHLKKKNNRKIIIPSIDDFFGSGDKIKQSKGVILISSDNEHIDPKFGRYGTYFYIPKVRIGGVGKNMVARCIFNTKNNKYEDNYELLWRTDFGESVKQIPAERLPYWYDGGDRGLPF